MHAFARDVSLTPDEWLRAIGFLTKVGQACTPARQEFILLSDVLGLTALLTSPVNHAPPTSKRKGTAVEANLGCEEGAEQRRAESARWRRCVFCLSTAHALFVFR